MRPSGRPRRRARAELCDSLFDGGSVGAAGGRSSSYPTRRGARWLFNGDGDGCVGFRVCEGRCVRTVTRCSGVALELGSM